MSLPISAADVRDAAVRIQPLARRTPVLAPEAFEALSGRHVYLKCENLQRGGAFKIRGAANRILALSPEERSRGVVAFSSGNHAQAVAIAAKHVGAAATIVMPEDAPRSKMEPTRALGAHIITYNRFTEDREAIAAKILGESGGALVPPFDHPMIMAGRCWLGALPRPLQLGIPRSSSNISMKETANRGVLPEPHFTRL